LDCLHSHPSNDYNPAACLINPDHIDGYIKIESVQRTQTREEFAFAKRTPLMIQRAMTVEVKVRKHHSDIRVNQEDNNEDGRFFSGSPPVP
jgi:hypothetical protein